MSTKQMTAIIVANGEVIGPFGWEEFFSGYEAGIRGADLSDMQTKDERKGWWYSRRCAGSKHNEHDGAIEDDYGFIREGGA